MTYNMYVCPDCRKLYKISGSGKKAKCPKCIDSVLVDTGIIEETWKAYSPEEKKNIISNLLDEPEIIEADEMYSSTEPLISQPKSTNSFFGDVNENTPNMYVTQVPENNNYAGTKEESRIKKILMIAIPVASVIIIVCIILALIFGKNKPDSNNKIHALQQEDYKEPEDSSFDKNNDHDLVNENDNEKAIADLQWTTYECDPILLDLQPQKVTDPYYDAKKYPAIKSFCMQVDDVVFDDSERVFTVSEFVEKFKNGADAELYRFWINDGKEIYEPERLMGGETVIVISKNGYGYCKCSFQDPEEAPIPISDFSMIKLNIEPCEPYIFNEEGITTDIENALKASTFNDLYSDLYFDYNYYALENIWYMGGIRCDGEINTGGKIKYADADTFYENLGLTKIDDAQDTQDNDGHFFVNPVSSDARAVSMSGTVLAYDCIIDHPRFPEQCLVMKSVHYHIWFDLKTQECLFVDGGLGYDTEHTRSHGIGDGLIYEKEKQPIIE